MSETRDFNQNFAEKTSVDKKLAYSEDFKDFISNHPKAIGVFKEINREINGLPIEDLSKGHVFQRENLTATILKVYTWGGEQKWVYYKLDIDAQSFFVKSEGAPWRGKGYDEFKNTQTAKEKLKDVEGVEVVDPQFGYQDSTGRTYFVSKYLDLPLLEKFLDDNLSPEGDPENIKGKQLRQRAEKIRDLLPDFHDVAAYNMFYDPQKDKIVIFDLFTEPQDLYHDEDLKGLGDFGRDY